MNKWERESEWWTHWKRNWNRKSRRRTAEVENNLDDERSRAGQMREWEKKEREIGQWINSPCGLLAVAAGAGLPQGGLARPSSPAIKLARLQLRIKFSPSARLLHCSLYKTMSSLTTTTWALAVLAAPAWSDSPGPDADRIYWSFPSFLLWAEGVGARDSSSHRNTPYTDVSLFTYEKRDMETIPQIAEVADQLGDLHRLHTWREMLTL